MSMYDNRLIKHNDDVDITVIGAGPAGLVAAATCGQSGASVVLLEKDPWPGGRLGIQSQPLQGPKTIYKGQTGFEHRDKLVETASNAGVKMRLGVQVTSVLQPKDETTGFNVTLDSSLDYGESFQSKTVIIATGSTEPIPRFPGAELHGVMCAGTAQVTLNIRGQLVGRRIVMVGSDNAGLLISKNLMDAGADIVAVIDTAPSVLGRAVNLDPIRKSGAKIFTSARLSNASGDGKLENIRIVSVEKPTSSTYIMCDTLCIAYPRVPEARLIIDIGCPVVTEEALGGTVPIHNRNFASPIRGLFICGDAAGVENGAFAMETARISGLAALGYIGKPHRNEKNLSNLAQGRLSYLHRGKKGAYRRAAKNSIYAQYNGMTG